VVQLSTGAATAGVARAVHPAAAAALVLGGAALFGTVGTAQALGPDVPAASLAAARMLLAALCLAALAVLARRGAGVLVAGRHAPTWWAGVGQGFFNLCFLAAMKEAGVAVGTLVAIGAAPLITGLIARRVTRTWLVATGVAICGLALLVGGQRGGPDAPSWVGLALALGAAASYATYIVAGHAAEARGLETQSYLAAAFSVSALVTMPWLVLGDLTWILTASGAAVLGYLVLVPTVVAYSLFNRGLRGVRSSTAATLALIEPVVAAGLAVAVLDERLGVQGAMGAVLILLGLLVVVRSSTGSGPREQSSAAA